MNTRKALADAVRLANVLYGRLESDRDRDSFQMVWLDLERAVTTAESAGDDTAVIAAITRWRSSVNARFGGNQ